MEKKVVSFEQMPGLIQNLVERIEALEKTVREKQQPSHSKESWWAWRMFANYLANPNLRCTERWDTTTFRLSARVTVCTSTGRQSRSGSRGNKIESASPISRSSRSLWLPTRGDTEIDASEVVWWIRQRLTRRISPPFSLSIFDRTITPLPLYNYKIVYKLFSNSTSIWQILQYFCILQSLYPQV